MKPARVDPYFEFALKRDESMTITCPYCHEPAGKPCRNKLNGDELTHIPAHDARLREAK